MRQIMFVSTVVSLLLVGSAYSIERAQRSQKTTSPKLELTVLTTSRMGDELPAGQYRVVFETKMDNQHWRDRVRLFVEVEDLRVVEWNHFMQVIGSDMTVTTIDDIVVRTRPTFSRVALLSESTDDRVIFTVKGLVGLDSLQTLAMGTKKVLIYQE